MTESNCFAIFDRSPPVYRFQSASVRRTLSRTALRACTDISRRQHSSTWRLNEAFNLHEYLSIHTPYTHETIELSGVGSLSRCARSPVLRSSGLKSCFSSDFFSPEGQDTWVRVTTYLNTHTHTRNRRERERERQRARPSTSRAGLNFKIKKKKHTHTPSRAPTYS